MVDSGFVGSDRYDEDDEETSDEDDVMIIETGRPWKIGENVKIKTEILDEIENFSANDELEIDKEFSWITKKIFSCNICKIVLSTKGELKNHQADHDNHNLFQCNLCGQSFSRSSKLKKHARCYFDFDHDHRPRICQNQSTVRFRGRCPKERCFLAGIREKNGSRENGAKHAKKKSFECPICKKFLLSSSSLRAHMLVHTANSPYRCDLCPARFKRPSVLKSHKLIHSNYRQFECDICKHRFHFKGALKHHILSHYGTRPYKCKYCGKRYKRSWGLKIHTFRHTGVKRFECDICKSRFSVKLKLAKHIYKHMGEKPYECELCSRQFAESYVLKSHKCLKTKKSTTSMNNANERSIS